MFAATGNNDLRGLVAEAVLAFELVGDGLAQLGDAAGGRVLSEALVECLDGSIFDVLRGIEIRFTRAKTDHILSLGFHLFGLRINRQRERGRERSGVL